MSIASLEPDADMVTIVSALRRDGAVIVTNLADADLIGCPVRLVLSKRTADKLEWKLRKADKADLFTPEEVLQRLLAGV